MRARERGMRTPIQSRREHDGACRSTHLMRVRRPGGYHGGFEGLSECDLKVEMFIRMHSALSCLARFCAAVQLSAIGDASATRTRHARHRAFILLHVRAPVQPPAPLRSVSCRVCGRASLHTGAQNHVIDLWRPIRLCAHVLLHRRWPR